MNAPVTLRHIAVPTAMLIGVAALAAPAVARAPIASTRAAGTSAKRTMNAELPARGATATPAPHQRTRAHTTARCNLQPHSAIPSQGGVVEHNPKIDLVFWGYPRNLEKLDHEMLAMTLEVDALQSMRGSREGRVITQYCDATGYAHNDARLKRIWIDSSPGTLRKSAVAEVKRAIQHWALPLQGNNVRHSVQANTQIMLILPPKHNAGGYCGYHDELSNGTSYSLVGGPGIGGCYMTPSDPTGGTVNTEIHEAYETMSDRQPFTDPAWIDFNNGEIGDMCENGPDAIQQTALGQLDFAQIWNDRRHRCSGRNPGLKVNLTTRDVPQSLGPGRPTRHVFL